MRCCVIAVSVFIAGTLSAQSRSSSNGEMTANQYTANLERLLKGKGVRILPAPDGPLPDIDVSIDGKKPITPPPPPPPPPPVPQPPPGPAPFMPDPPGLEDYREAIEVQRKQIERQRETGKINFDTYQNGITEYKRRIDLYKQATKLTPAKDE